MLRLFHFSIICIISVMPLLAQAPFSKEYVPGSYVLGSDSTKRIVGQLRLKNHWKLLVITLAGSKLRLKPTEVNSFWLGTHTYVVARNFLVQQGSHIIDVKAAFAERLDSGQVTLLKYTHLYNSGADWLFLYRYPISFYLVSGVAENLVPVHNYHKHELFQQEARLPLQSRSDLMQLLSNGRITYDNFPAAINALNHNLPFNPTAATRRSE